MSISVSEFQLAMETYGAKRLSDQYGSRYKICVPCFSVRDVNFLHSASYYVVQRNARASEEIMNQAMAALGEKYPGDKHFWWGEIHSVKGLLTLASLLEGKYSKELVDNLTNETYKKLLANQMFTKNIEFPFIGDSSPKMGKLIRKLEEFSTLVNPFCNQAVELKDPIEFVDGKVTTSVDVSEDQVSLSLMGRSACTEFRSNPYKWGWFYDATVYVQIKRCNGYINMRHYYENGVDEPEDEVVYLDYKANENTYEAHPDDINDLRISLKTGLAWKTYHEEEATPATEEQIDTMIKFLNICNKKMKQRIIRYMTTR